MSRKWSPAVEAARDRLFDQLMFSGLPAAERWQLIDDFAHALAEQQRYEHDEVGGGCDLGVCHGSSLPDLIDPEPERPVSSEEKTR